MTRKADRLKKHEAAKAKVDAWREEQHQKAIALAKSSNGVGTTIWGIKFVLSENEMRESSIEFPDGKDWYQALVTAK